jgi:hypothetical protein
MYPAKQEAKVMNTDFSALSPTPVRASVIIGALHESRRREAMNVIHRYRNLISDRVETDLREPIPSPGTKARFHQILKNERERNVRRLSETHLMILVLLGFGIVHVIGGVLMARATTEHGNPVVNIAASGN